ncbi:hypothetical protein [Bacillus sp. Marseille-P3661]|uniref:hypothetical protein n=1 Tax=Bacillus sp. Marseille-P3661 TaxID=1936234 RepID=UPI000C82D62B|nr:hypothetical protein [Bacillus sp. Marseille-P3661]
MSEKTIILSNPADVEKLYERAKNEVFPHLRDSCRALSSEFFEHINNNSNEYEIDFDTNKALYYFVRHFKEIVPVEMLDDTLKLSLDDLARQVSITDAYITDEKGFEDNQHQMF